MDLAAAADGSGKGRVKIAGVFAFSGTLDLGAPGATVAIQNGLHEAGGAGEMMLETVTIGSRWGGQHTLAVDISGAVIDLPTAGPQPHLTTSIAVDDGINLPFVLDIQQPWQCVQRGGGVEYLRTP